MASGSTMDLLFRIAADSSQAQGDLGQLRGAVAGTMAGLGDAAGVASAKTSASTTEARHAIRGLGEEIGVRMPRFVSSWLTSLGGVSTVMAAAFTPIAIIGFVDILAKIPETLQKGVDWLHGWTEESKKAFEESTKHALKWQTDMLDVQERLRAIQLIGVEGVQKYNLEMAINSKNISEVANKIDQLRARQSALNEVLNWKPGPEPANLGMGAGYGTIGGGPQVNPHTHEEIEKAKLEVKELGPIIEALTGKLTDLTIKGKEIPAEAAAAAAKAAAKPLEDFRGLSQVLDQVQGKLAGTGTEEEKVRVEMAKLGDEADRQKARLLELQAKGKISPETFRQEMGAWEYVTRMIPEAQSRMYGEIDKKRAAEIQKGMAELSQATMTEWIQRLAGERQAGNELRAELAKGNATILEEQLRAWDAEMDARRDALDTSSQDYARNLAMVQAIRRQGAEKIRADAQASGDAQIAQLRGHLQQIDKENQTSEERIIGQYRADLAKFSAMEEQKALKTATAEAQRTQITAMYAAIRAALLGKEQTDLAALRNSQGWQGVLGSPFAQMIRGDEALWREWASSANQSHMLVRASLEGLREVGQRTFGQFAQGMGQNIANALVYKKSVGEAMREAAASTLESLAAESITYAIYSTALGFLRLAQYDYVGAGQAFTSAAIWGSVGAAAAIGGRLIAPAQGGQAGTGAGAAGASGGAAGPGASTGSNAQGGPTVNVYVQGHLVGWSHIGEVMDAISDAVVNSDYRLISSQAKNPRAVVKG